MKKTITFCFVGFVAFTLNAQLPVSQTPGKKQALLEEFTGNTCGYCPDGHSRSDQITAANPGKAFAINIHSGSYATPSSSSASKDFRTPDGDAILAMPGNTGGGFPKGAINRRTPTASGTVPYSTGGWTMNRGYWSSNVSLVLNENAYVNIAGEASLNPTSRTLVVNLEAYYTATAPVGSNQVTLVLVQNNIIAYQSGASTWYPSMLQTANDNNTYKHMHALRDIISSPATGETMGGPVSQGTTWTKSYYYTVPATFPASGTKTIPAVLNDLELIAFITEPTGNVIAVCKVPITQSATAGVSDLTSATDPVSFVNVYPNPMQNEGALVFTLAKPNPVTVTVTNALGQLVISDKFEALAAGEHKYELNTINMDNGVYFVNVESGGSIITKKFSVLK